MVLPDPVEEFCVVKVSQHPTSALSLSCFIKVASISVLCSISVLIMSSPYRWALHSPFAPIYGLQGLWIGTCNCPTFVLVSNLVPSLGQVVALFIVGLGEYFVVWLGTDWDLEVQRGVDRNQEEAKRRSIDRASGEEECATSN